MDLLTHYLQIIFLGVVEGVTEFLPISSTGHLLIAEHFLGSQEPDIFNVVIQAGAILAVVFIYWHKIVGLLSNLDLAESRNYLLKVLLAFVVTSVLILILQVKLNLKLTESLTAVAWATLIGGLVIFAVEAFAKHLYARDEVTWFEAVLVGVGQVIAALFPGASRSGSTIMAGLAVGMKRPVVTEFSFLVGIPTMFAASVFDAHKAYKNGELHALGHQVLIDTAIGFLVAMVVAFFVVKWLLRFVQTHTFNGFAIYRVILGGALLVAVYMKVIPDVQAKEPQHSKEVAPAAEPVFAPVTPAVTNASASAPAADTNSVPVSPVQDGTTQPPPSDSIKTNGADGILTPPPATSATNPASTNVPTP